MMELFTYEELKNAYRKFKAWAYYDSSSLVLFDKIIVFEQSHSFKKNLANILTALNSGNTNKYLKNVDYYVLPKKTEGCNDEGDCKQVKEDRSAFFYSNDKASDEMLICTKDHFNFMIDATVEQQLIAVLWLMNVGVYLQNEQIEKFCYGNILCLDKNCGNGKKLESGIRLFQRYFDKYSYWRDKGIECCRRIVEEEHNNALLVSLDVKRFYPNSNIDFDKLNDSVLHLIDISTLNENEKEIAQEKAKFLNGCLKQLFENYNCKILSKSNSLPIGLVCSGVIANWYLSDFDNSMMAQFTPAYYGRYVDDVFMVIPNVMGGNVKEWWYSKCNENITSLHLKNEDGKELFLLDGYEGKLRVNVEKLKLFFFSPDYSLALLENFQKQIEDNSSMFWLYPDDDVENENFDNASYDVVYDDTIFSFRSVKGIRLSKFRLSAFLAKKLKEAIIAGRGDDRLKEYIFKTFKGCNLINFYAMWEKLYSYFVITGDVSGVETLKRSIADTVRRLNAKTDSEIANMCLQESLMRLSDRALIMALTLNTDMVDRVGENDKLNQVYALRNSYLVRVHYLPISAVLYYNETNTIPNISSPHVVFDILDAFKNRKMESAVSIVPRHVNLYEICLMEIYKAIANYEEDSNEPLFERQGYIDSCMNKFRQLNPVFDNYGINNDGGGSSEGVKLSKFEFNSTDVLDAEFGRKVLFGLSNIKVSHTGILNKIKGKPSDLSSNKRKRYFSLLNKTIEERVNCLLMPECYLPLEWLPIYAVDSGRKNRLTVTGLEHFIFNDYCFNIAVAMVPFQFKGVPIKEVLLLPRLKNFYSPSEERMILQYRHKVPKILCALYDVINWNGIRYTIFNCFELANINHRALFKSQIDVMLAVEVNSDTYYYGNIAETTSRDLHCYFIQSNTSDYGDSRVVVPKKNEEMNPVRVKGGENDTVLTVMLDVDSLIHFQSQDPLYQQPDDKTFKPIPPGFKRRENNCKVFTSYRIETPSK